MRKFRLALGALLFGVALAAAQNSTGGPSPAQPAPAPPRAQFFAGTIVEFDATHIKVSRTLVGRPTESRSFAVTASTKMNKTVVKLHSSVTVRYKRLPEGDTALEIQPRPAVARTPKM